MGMKEATGRADVTIRLGGFDKETRKDNPTSLEGFYLGARTITTKKGEAVLHGFTTSKGTVDVWGKTDLNSKLKDIPVGVFVAVKFTGMKQTGNGEMYMYKVMYDLDNTIDVSGLDASVPEEDETEDEYVEPPPVERKRPSVKELLAKKN